jgi:hypothetical protein
MQIAFRGIHAFCQFERLIFEVPTPCVLALIVLRANCAFDELPNAKLSIDHVRGPDDCNAISRLVFYDKKIFYALSI